MTLLSEERRACLSEERRACLSEERRVKSEKSNWLDNQINQIFLI